jgi:hypothetical protein
MRFALRSSMNPPCDVVKTRPVSRHHERARGKPFFELSFAVRSQDVHQRRHIGSRDRRICFQRAQSQLTVDPMQCLPDRQPAPSKSASAQASPSASPRRSPIASATAHSAYSRPTSEI